VPPAQVVQKIVFTPCLELLIVGESVVDPPYAGGDVVGQDDVYGIVAPGQQQEDDAAQSSNE